MIRPTCVLAALLRHALLVGTVCLPATHPAQAEVTTQVSSAFDARTYLAVVNNRSITGSAFAIADGIVATNAHVLHGLARGGQVILSLPGRSGTRVRASVLSIGRGVDIGFLQIPKGLLAVVPATNASVRANGTVYAGGVTASSGRSGPRSVAAGSVIATGRHLPRYGPGFIARMPDARSGFSGGPVFDAAGHLVGMLAAIRPAGGQRHLTQTYIISASTARRKALR